MNSEERDIHLHIQAALTGGVERLRSCARAVEAQLHSDAADDGDGEFRRGWAVAQVAGSVERQVGRLERIFGDAVPVELCQERVIAPLHSLEAHTPQSYLHAVHDSLQALIAVHVGLSDRFAAHTGVPAMGSGELFTEDDLQSWLANG